MFIAGDCGYRLYANATIVAHNDLYEYDKEPAACMATCDKVGTFTCRSFEYNDEFGYCQYSSGNRWIHAAYYTSNDKEWDYYHKTCYTGEFIITPRADLECFNGGFLFAMEICNIFYLHHNARPPVTRIYKKSTNNVEQTGLVSS